MGGLDAENAAVKWKGGEEAGCAGAVGAVREQAAGEPGGGAEVQPLGCCTARAPAHR